MTEDSSFNAFLNEFKASLAGPDSEAIARRINAERLVELAVEGLIEEQPTHNIRLVADQRLAGEVGADFLVQVDDYDVRLELIDTSDQPALTDANLEQALRLLEDNPSTVALVFVWTTDDLRSVHISLARIRLLQHHPNRRSGLLTKAKPLSETLNDILTYQTKQWEFVLVGRPLSNAQPADIRRLFEDAISQAIEAERDRTYYNLERKQAALTFPMEDEKRVIFTALHDALQGAEAKELTARLTKISRRGSA